MASKKVGKRKNVTEVIVYRQQHTRRTLLNQLKKLEVERQQRDRAHAHQVVLFLAGTSHRKEARARHIARLVTMFKVKHHDNDRGTDNLHTPLQQQQQQQQQQTKQQQAEGKQKEQEGGGVAGSSTESEISVGSYQSSSVSQGPAERAALWVSDTPKRQRALSVDVPTEVPQDTPRRRSAPEVVVTHVALLDDADNNQSSHLESRKGRRQSSETLDSEGTQGGPSPPDSNTLLNNVSQHGRLSPTLMPVPSSSTPSPPRTPSGMKQSQAGSRPGSRISRASRTSLILRKSSLGTTQQQESVALTEISAPLEDGRFLELVKSLTLVAAPQPITTQRVTKGPDLKQDAPLLLKF